ncbi:transposase [Modicisalibacter tunisiensis]|uniref:Uncharacterized protein n=1 Tax=Modicisalibacter tunisiensis TaxID=390637 RepID=A0ABS7WUN5_9GAMM|nr:transposase [Modicisalibacter tunisiensis]KXS38871.1 MAG: hypothetical protein AWU55_966 [Halomonadaceae bacterium T82-2]MBZ9540277.1 hypothetical protein [Modicisalibacter tunisiensis]MBZ9566315.1 hypothetical protein [Modicisalibacter tunisiensis]
MKAPTGPECPVCGSREKRFPPGREGQYHVFCDNCDHDFGRYDQLIGQFRHILDDLEHQLGIDDASPRSTPESSDAPPR